MQPFRARREAASTEPSQSTTRFETLNHNCLASAFSRHHHTTSTSLSPVPSLFSSPAGASPLPPLHSRSSHPALAPVEPRPEFHFHRLVSLLPRPRLSIRSGNPKAVPLRSVPRAKCSTILLARDSSPLVARTLQEIEHGGDGTSRRRLLRAAVCLRPAHAISPRVWVQVRAWPAHTLIKPRGCVCLYVVFLHNGVWFGRAIAPR